MVTNVVEAVASIKPPSCVALSTHHGSAEISHAADSVASQVARRSTRTTALASPPVVLIVPWRAPSNDHFCRFACGYLDELIAATLGPNIAPEFDDQLVILLSSPSFSVVLCSLLELDSLERMLCRQLLATGLVAEIVGVNRTVGYGRVRKHAHMVVVTGFTGLATKSNLFGFHYGSLVSLWCVLYQLDVV